jgi:hypothetical protein
MKEMAVGLDMAAAEMARQMCSRTAHVAQQAVRAMVLGY